MPTSAARRAVLLPAALLAVGLVMGRADVVLLAVPLLLAAVTSLLRRPPEEPVRTLPQVAAWVEQGREVDVVVHVAAPALADVVTVALPRGARMPQGRSLAVVPRPGGRVLRASAVPPGWGRVTLARPDCLALACDGLLACGPLTGGTVTALVLPGVDAVPPAPLPPRPAGLVGLHRTRRPGDGSDLLDVHAFRPGDRLRRIDWRVSARRGEVHVRRTAVDADAHVVLCLDTRTDVSADGATWARPTDLPAGAHRDEGSSLGRAVRTATALAAAHLAAGDRVALLDLAQPLRGVRSGGGRRQLLRIRHRLAQVRAVPDAASIVVRPWAIPAGAVVVVLSPFLDDSVADLALGMRRRGARVLALDVLPQPVVLDGRRPWLAQAQQVLLAERTMRLRALAARGVDVLPADAATLAPRLRRIALARR